MPRIEIATLVSVKPSPANWMVGAPPVHALVGIIPGGVATVSEACAFLKSGSTPALLDRPMTLIYGMVPVHPHDRLPKARQ